MTKIQKSALVPCTPREMFTLVADIDSYPQFLPWCTDARVLSRAGVEVTARVALAKSGFSHAFTTRNTLKECERIDMQLVEGPFKRLHGHWSFEPAGDMQGGTQGCVVALSLDFELASKLLVLTFGRAFHSIANTMLDSFCTRARQLYAPRQ